MAYILRILAVTDPIVSVQVVDNLASFLIVYLSMVYVVSVMVWARMGLAAALLEAAARGDAARLASLLAADSRDINVTDEVRIKAIKRFKILRLSIPLLKKLRMLYANFNDSTNQV